MHDMYVLLKIFILVHLEFFIFQGMIKMSIKNFYFNHKKINLHINSYI